MPRPTKCRHVGYLSPVKYFKPAGIPTTELAEITLTQEEMEAIRLKDLLGLEQIEAAEKMGISRPTFHRILKTAREKIARALILGYALKIEGGSFTYKNPEEEKNMKIAVASVTGKDVSAHFGSAPKFVIFTVEDGKIVGSEILENTFHGPHHHHPPHHHHEHGHGHGGSHARILEAFAGVKVVISGGMGWRMQEDLKAHGITPVLTTEKDAQRAVEKYLEGTLETFEGSC
ncbi:hypothetical protein ciss_14690 [Carboxydothermus islandicus]|uniref:UPF0251 protein ciss_14690 n=1 Tax=Carboxydothermus islandicus TaxID=661089 RepID=A0A1L8D2W3_9THEO|nr:DUF134 domain-containing protein [Carboxydothermus islandicus]GAV25536.1 hypothetical protein ciss_14690 [Carboxydothermus islandicus]